MIYKLDGCCTGAAFGTIDHDEVRGDTGFDHGFGDGKPFPSVSDAQLEPNGFAAR
jgi:hypothetical protein